jgi:hypothetical protein
MSTSDPWPSLPLEAWKDTFATLHRWTQIVGKIRLVQTPWINHSWHVPLYVTSRGLTTSPIPHGAPDVRDHLRLLDHALLVRGQRRQRGGACRCVPVRGRVPPGTARHAGRTGARRLHPRQPERAGGRHALREDRRHASYDPEYATRFWRMLVQSSRVFQAFRAPFLGKCSPVHFFWGSFDLAVTRFSGRTAPPHPGGIPNLPDWVAREAYSHEVSSCGFWPGGGPHPYPLFYSYAYPEPAGFASARVEPEGAFYSTELREWVLPTKWSGARRRRTGAARVSGNDLRGRRRAGGVGSKVAGAWRIATASGVERRPTCSARDAPAAAPHRSCRSRKSEPAPFRNRLTPPRADHSLPVHS